MRAAKHVWRDLRENHCRRRQLARLSSFFLSFFLPPGQRRSVVSRAHDVYIAVSSIHPLTPRLATPAPF